MNLWRLVHNIIGNSRHTTAHHAEFFGGTVADIQNSPSNKWATVIHSHDHIMLVAQVGTERHLLQHQWQIRHALLQEPE